MNPNINYAFTPKSIAVIGASRDKNSVGNGIVQNLLNGAPEQFKSPYSQPFQGKLFLVNPNAAEIDGRKCYPNIKSISEDIDLAIIAIPARFVKDTLNDCISKKVKAAIIISAGFAEVSKEGKELQDKIKAIAKKAGIALIGPNCLGIINAVNPMNASFAPGMPPKGDIAFISQSGALADSVIDWAIEEKYGFRAIVSYGNKAGLDETDFIEYFGNDEHTKAIALYVESIDDGKKFMEIASKVSRKKPVLILKSGRTEKGMKAASSHTGSLAGSYEVYKAAFRQSGVIIADTVEELFDLSVTLAKQPPCDNAIAIVTNAGGPGVLTADYCELLGINLVDLKDSTIKKLDETKLMHPAYSRHNPLDLVGDALPERYEAALNTLLAEDYISGLIVIQTLQTMTDPKKDAEAVIKASKRFPQKPILCVYMGGKFSKAGASLLQENDIPDFNDLRKAAVAMKCLVDRKKIMD